MNNKQKLFCEEYVKNGNNGKNAYMSVYKVKKEEIARTNASRLLTNANVKLYIQKLQDKLEDESIMSAKDRMKWLTNVIINKDQKQKVFMSDRLKALDMLNKMSGEYTTKQEINIESSWFK